MDYRFTVEPNGPNEILVVDNEMKRCAAFSMEMLVDDADDNDMWEDCE